MPQRSLSSDRRMLPGISNLGSQWELLAVSVLLVAPWAQRQAEDSG